MKYLIISVFLVALLLVLFSHNMQHDILRDQNQFIASGKLLASSGLLPYQDYPYSHLPYLVFIYGLIFRFTDHSLLAARVFSTFSAWLSMGIIFYLTSIWFANKKNWLRLGLAAGAVLLVITNPLFIDTSGREWNHDLQILFILIAFLLYHLGTRRNCYWAWIFGTGLALGLATGTRLTMAFLPFLMITLLTPVLSSLKKRLRNAAILTSGFILALAPAITLFIISPQQFIFGNFQYPYLNTIFRQITNYESAMTLPAKIIFWFKEVLLAPANLGLTLLVLVSLVFVISMLFKKQTAKPTADLPLLLLLTLSMFLMALAPTPSWYWYFYAPLPITILLLMALVAQIIKNKPRLIWLTALLPLVITISVIANHQPFRDVAMLGRPDGYVPNQAHEFGLKIKKMVPAGPVLTLAPLFPLEANLDIYPEFVNSPFYFRVADFLPPPERARLKLVGPWDLENFLAAKPPAAVLTGFEGADLEQPLIDYATFHGYQPHYLPTIITPAGVTVWTP